MNLRLLRRQAGRVANYAFDHPTICHRSGDRAAITVFARRGYFDTKVIDIVQAAGISQPTFYSYFDSKEAACDQLVGEFRAWLEAITGDNLIDPSTPAERFVERSRRAAIMLDACDGSSERQKSDR